MKKLFLLLIIPFLSFGQGWEQTYGAEDDDEGFHFQQTNDGGYIIVGRTMSFGNGGRDVYLIKTDENGNEEWSQAYGGSDDDQGFFVQETMDGGYIIVGQTMSFENEEGEVYLIKTDENGNEEWSFWNFPDDSNWNSAWNLGRYVQETDDGGFIVWGTYGVYKIDEAGEEIEWFNIVGGGIEIDKIFEVQKTSDAGFILFGPCTASETDGCLIKTDSLGNLEWSQSYDGFWDESDVCWSVRQTLNGGYILIGTEPINSGIHVIKINEIGNIIWSQNYGGLWGMSINLTNDEGYIICGWGFEGVLIIKIDENGNEDWTQIYGEPFEDENPTTVGMDVQQSDDGGYIICGVTYMEELENQTFLIKTDSEGNVTNTSIIEPSTQTSERKLVRTTNVLGQENITIKNQSLIEIYDDGSVEKKYLIK